jgi:ketosteroid isomerase-like protein
MKLTVKGLEQIVKKFETARIKQVVNDNLKRITEEIQVTIKGAAQVLTGKFRKGITHKYGDDGQSASIYTPLFYGRFQEYGTVKMQAQSGVGKGIGAFAYGEQEFNTDKAEKQTAADLEGELTE